MNTLVKFLSAAAVVFAVVAIAILIMDAYYFPDYLNNYASSKSGPNSYAAKRFGSVNGYVIQVLENDNNSKAVELKLCVCGVDSCVLYTANINNYNDKTRSTIVTLDSSKIISSAVADSISDLKK